MVKAQIILKMVGNQMIKMVRRKLPVRAIAKAVVVAAVAVVTATAVVTAVIPAGVLLIPAAARPSKNTSTSASERNVNKRQKKSKFPRSQMRGDTELGKTLSIKTLTRPPADLTIKP